MARPSRRRNVSPSVPAAVLLLARQLSMAHTASLPPAFVFPVAGSISIDSSPAARGQSFGTGASKATRSTCLGKRPNAPSAAGPGGIGHNGAVSRAAAAVAVGHSEEQTAWLGRIQYYAGREMWRKAEDKFQQMQDEGVQPTLAICNGLMEAYLKAGRYVNAVGFLEDLCLGNILGGDNGATNKAAAGDAESAAEAAAAAATTAAPIIPTFRTFNLVLATLATAGKWKKALAVSAPMRGQSDGGGGGRGAGRGGRAGSAAADGALKAVAAELTADGETYTHLIVACGKGGEPDRARQMFDEMRAGGIVPPPEATAALIRALARGGQGSKEALRLLGDMRAGSGGHAGGGGSVGSSGWGEVGRGGGSDAAAAHRAGFSGAIEACALNGEWQKAVSLLDEMRQSKMSPDGRCYGNAMRACATGGNWQLALALLNTMKKEGVPRTAFNYNIAMRACRKAERNGKAMALLAEMEKDGVAPDIVTYNTCVTITGQAGRLDEALELLRKASEEAGLTLDVVSYRAALGGLRRAKRWEAAVKLLGDMQRRGMRPDEVSTAMAMNTCVSAQEPLRALDLFRDMRDVAGVFPGISSVTALLEALADLGRWEDALRELRALSASGVKPDGKAIAYTMAACNSAKKWDQTLSLRTYAEKMGIEISMEGLVLVARAHAGRKDWQGVVGVLGAAERACSEATAAMAADSNTGYGGQGGGDAGRGGVVGGAGGAIDVRRPPAELYEVVARSLALAGMWEEAASAVRKLEKLPPRKSHQQGMCAGLSTYELIMAAAGAAGRDDAVLTQADAARRALRESHSVAPDSDDSSSSSDYGGSAEGHAGGELTPAALAHEVSAAGRLGQWDRVSPLMAKAMRSPSLRGVAGARLYAALIGAAAACGKPERGLEVFREMLADSTSTEVVAPLEDGGVGAEAAGAGGVKGEAGRRCLPPPDGATFIAALDACAAVGGEKSVKVAVGVTKRAAAAAAPARDFQEGGEGASGKRVTLSRRRLADVLARAGEVCAAAGSTSTADAFAAKALEIGASSGTASNDATSSVEDRAVEEAEKASGDSSGGGVGSEALSEIL